jgi:hypothetical protein
MKGTGVDTMLIETCDAPAFKPVVISCDHNSSPRTNSPPGKVTTPKSPVTVPVMSSIINVVHLPFS